MTKCKQCSSEILIKTNIFCNSSCAAKFNNVRKPKRSLTSRQKTAKSVCESLGVKYVEKPHRNPNPLISATKSGYAYTKIYKCTACLKYFDCGTRKSTTCSDECFIYVKTVINNRGKKLVYNGVSLDSTWELSIAKYLDSKAILWSRPITHIVWVDKEGKNRKYFPDFYLPEYDIYLDPKNNYVASLQKEKIQYLSEHFGNIIIGDLPMILAYLEGLEPTCNPVTLSTVS